MLGDVTEFRRLDEMKNGLLSLVSHELKTPLTSMRMILPLLIEGKVGPPLPDRQSELLVAVREDAERLHRIVENLLDMGRLESGRGLVDVRPVPAGELVERSIEPLRAAFRDANVTLAYDPARDAADEPVLADATRIGHVFANLLTNALRYTPAGGAVRVRLRGPATASNSASATPGPASRGSTSTACSRSSSACPASPARAARGWGWRSSRTSSKPTAATSASKAPRAAARPSASPCALQPP